MIRFCGKKSWGFLFCLKKCLCQKSEHFSEKKYCFFTNINQQHLSPCPKRIRPLIKPLLKNSFSTNFQGTGPWEGPIHFSRFVLSVHNCGKLFQSWSWSQEKKGLFHNQLPNSKSKPFPKESDRLLNPYWRTVFPQISKALGHERVQFTLVGLFSGFTIAANFSRADPGAKKRKNSLLQKQPVLSLSLFLSLSLSLSLSLIVSLSLPLSLPLPLPLPLSLPLPLLLPLPLPLSLFFFLSFPVFFRSLSLSLIAWFIKKKL